MCRYDRILNLHVFLIAHLLEKSRRVMITNTYVLYCECYGDLVIELITSYKIQRITEWKNRRMNIKQLYCYRKSILNKWFAKQMKGTFKMS